MQPFNVYTGDILLGTYSPKQFKNESYIIIFFKCVIIVRNNGDVVVGHDYGEKQNKTNAMMFSTTTIEIM